MTPNPQDARNIAVFIDLENVAIGVKDARFRKFDISLVMRRLLQKGNVVVRRAYADWRKYDTLKRPMHEAGVELTELPGSTITGKNSADIKMVVDALDLCFSKPHIDAFALVTGDSDFYPLVSKLRENNKHTTGIGVKNSTSPLLIDCCDEFIFYDDLVRKPTRKGRASAASLPDKQREAFTRLMEAVVALQRENKALHSSLVKDTIRRMQPQFNEEYHGYTSFNRLLEDAQKHKLVKLRRDAKSGTYVIEEVLE